jgi:hypothetical protein
VDANADGVATFAHTGAEPGTDTVLALALTSTGERRTATASITLLRPVPARVVLTPPSLHAFRGDRVEVTATVFDPAGAPLPEVPVRFSATGANRADGDQVTGADGRARFGYQGSNAGRDTITAFADVNRNGRQDVGEPFAVASADFVARPVGRVLVPDLTDMTRQGAEQALQRTQLNLGRVITRPGGSGLPRVIFQVPDAGTLVTLGSAVDITLMRTIDIDGPGRPGRPGGGFPGRPPLEP